MSKDDSIITDFVTKKFCLLFIRYFSLERAWDYEYAKNIWTLYLRFSYAWNHKGKHLVYRWHSE